MEQIKPLPKSSECSIDSTDSTTDSNYLNDTSYNINEKLKRTLSNIEITSNKATNDYIGSEYESDEDGKHTYVTTSEDNNKVNVSIEESIDESYGNGDEVHEIMNKIPPPRKIGFNEVKDAVRSTFFSDEDYNSTAFDIIATYIKGQKIIYMEAMTYCVTRLNVIMLPTILLSAIASVLSLTVDKYIWGPIMVASVNAFNGFLLAVVNYSKLDAASEAHKISSHQYDKLQSLCEFTSGKLMMANNTNSNKDEELTTIKKTMDEIEAKIKDIKETNSFVIPSTIRTRFMNIYHLNIFSVVKKIRDQEALLINKLKTKLNRVRNLEYLNKIGFVDNEQELTDNINDLNDEISNINSQIISIKTKFTIIDKMFKEEIRRAEVLKRRGWFISSCCYSIHDIDENEFISKNNYNSPKSSIKTIERKRKNVRSLIDSFERN